MNNKFIDEVKKHIKNKTAKQNIEDELSSHILDKIDYYVEIGYTRKQAEEMATEDMGDPEQTAVPLNSLHNIKCYKHVENWVSVALLLGELVITVLWGHSFLYISEETVDTFKNDMILRDYYPEEYSPTVYESNEKTLSLQEFLDLNFYTKACVVQKNNQVNQDNQKETQITFNFILEDSPYRLVYMIFRDNYLDELQFWY